MSVCLYVCVCVCVCVCVVHVHVQVYTYVYVCACVYVFVFVCVNVWMHVCMHMCICVCVAVQMDACIYFTLVSFSRLINKYHPKYVTSREEAQQSSLQSRIQAFLFLLESGRFDSISLWTECLDAIVKTMDTGKYILFTLFEDRGHWF